jgi:transposase-like protein
MPEHRRKFSPQFRAEAVHMVVSTDSPIAEVARDLGIQRYADAVASVKEAHSIIGGGR